MNEDAKFVVSLVAITSAIITPLIFLFISIDEDIWTEAPGDCFVRTQEVNTVFGKDSVTISEYCLVED